MLNGVYDFSFMYYILMVFRCGIFDKFCCVGLFGFIINIFVDNVKLFFVDFVLNCVVFCDFFFFCGYFYFFCFWIRKFREFGFVCCFIVCWVCVDN